jgi:hypothetical protein
MTDNPNRGGTNAPGQQKTWTVTNPKTGETRQCTSREWREQKLGQQGFLKPPDLDDSADEAGTTDAP